MTNHSKDLVDGVIRDWSNLGKAFTAYEVSREVRTRGGAERHLVMKDYIHNCDAMQEAYSYCGYTRTNICFSDGQGGSLTAWLYHHPAFNPKDYKPLDQNTLDSVAMPKQTPAKVVQHSLDSQKRLVISDTLLIKAGIGAGDRVKIATSRDKVLYVTVGSIDERVLLEQVVEPTGELFLSYATLLIGGLSEGVFVIENVDHFGVQAVKIFCVDKDGNRIT